MIELESLLVRTKTESTGDYIPQEQTILADKELLTIGDLWETCFGEYGYLNDQRPAKVTQDRSLIEKAYTLANYGHQDQRRQSGEPYIYHPLWAAARLAQRYKAPAYVVAGLLCHDVPEDTQKPAYPYPVSLENIQDLLGKKVGKKVRKYVEVLTAARKTQQLSDEPRGSKDRTTTVYNLICSLQKDPWIAIGKVYDRLHNIATLAAKPPKDRLSIAIDTYEIYVPIAKILGLHEEAQWLAEECFAVIDEAAHRDGLSRRVKEGIAQFLGSINTEEMGTEILDELSNMQDVVHRVVVTRPKAHEVMQILGKRREAQEEGYFLKVKIVLKDGDDEKIFNQQALAVITALSISGKYDSPPDGKIGLDKAAADIKAKLRPDLKFRLVHKDGRDTLLDIEVVKKSNDDLETTPLTYLRCHGLSEDDLSSSISGNGYTLDKRIALAKVKHDRWKRHFQEITRVNPHNPAEVVRMVGLMPPPEGCIAVSGEKTRGKRTEYARCPLPKGATILNYALTYLPGSWQRIVNIEINGQIVNDIGIVLRDGDRVHFEFCDDEHGNNVQVDWLDKVTVDQENAQRQIAEKLYAQLISIGDDTLRRERLVRALADRGWRIIAQQVPNLAEFGLGFARMEFPNSQMDARDFAFQVGLGNISQIVIDRVCRALNEFWNNLSVVVVYMPNIHGQATRVTDIFQRYGLNIIAQQQLSKWGDSARIVFRFDQNDEHYPMLGQAIAQIQALAGDGYEVQQFKDDGAYQEWFTQYRND